MESMLGAFRETVVHRAGAPAIRYFDATLTFGDLDERSDAFAEILRDHDVAHGDRVAAYLQNDPQLAIVALGAWKVGAILVVVSPMLRHKELRHVLDDSGATVLVALESLWQDVARETVPDTAVAHVFTTSELDLVVGPPPAVLATSARERDPAIPDLFELLDDYAGCTPPDPVLGSDDVAILTYTSGTTGPAKGALNTHGNLLFAARAYRDGAQVGPDDVILGIAPLFHITGLTAHLALSLLAGVPMVLTHRFELGTVLDAIEQHRPTFTVAAITAYVALMDVAGRDLSSLRRTLSGGAPIAPALAEAWERHVGVPLVPVYGLTETTGPTHMASMAGHPPIDPASGALSVGRAVPGTTARVIDEAGAELPPGQAGELVVGGPQVVPGYWDDPAETAIAFGPDGALRTGDVAVIDADGWAYIVDRKKDLINASGYKVWPREVEDGLLAHPAVREAAVVGVPDGYRGETVKAYVSLRAGEAVSADDLIAYCRERMAAYKYPRSIVVLDDLPKSATGKILRRVLRDEAAAGVSRA
jgi:long-chain acyl-CoA synthetase